jgi:hypothetical protein
MPGHISEVSESIDRKTSRSICEAVAERLQRSLPPEPSHLSDPLRSLMDELRKRDQLPTRFE